MSTENLNKNETAEKTFTRKSTWIKDYKPLIYSVIGMILLVASTIIYLSLNKFSISENSNIGDSFNGLLAPFISLFAAVLVYLSFMQQLRANKIITSQWEFDTYLGLFRDMVKNFEGIEVLHNWGTNEGIEKVRRTGRNAFNTIQEYGLTGPVQGGNIAIEELKHVLDEYIYLIQVVTDSEIERKEYLLYKMLRFYYSNFKGLSLGLSKVIGIEPSKGQKPTLLAFKELEDKIKMLERDVSSGIHVRKTWA